MRTLLVLVLCGCDSATVVETVRIGGAIEQLAIDVEAGEVEVSRADVDVITVTRTLTGPAGSVLVAQSVSDGVARITGGCRAFTACTVDVSVVVPADLIVDIHTGEGDVDVSDVADVLVDIGRGDLHVWGDVNRLRARIGWGDAAVTVASAPEDVAIELAGGDAVLRLPTGTYDMDVVAFGGDTIVGVINGPGPRVHVRTQGGSASIVGRDVVSLPHPG